MAVCINKNLSEYQALKEMSGIPEIVLDFYCSNFLDTYDRLPELDELPQVNSENYLRNAIKVTQIGDIDFADNAAIENTIGVLGEEASIKIPVGIIQADELKRTGIFFDAYKIAREKLIKELSEEKYKNWTCEKIKIQWKQKNLSATQTNSGTAKAMAIFQKKEQYLTNYLYIENSTPQDFLDAMEKYFPAEPLMKVYSADSKK